MLDGTVAFRVPLSFSVRQADTTPASKSIRLIALLLGVRRLRALVEPARFEIVERAVGSLDDIGPPPDVPPTDITTIHSIVVVEP